MVLLKSASSKVILEDKICCVKGKHGPEETPWILVPPNADKICSRLKHLTLFTKIPQTVTCKSKTSELWSQLGTTFYNEQKNLADVGEIGEIMMSKKVTGTSIYELFAE